MQSWDPQGYDRQLAQGVALSGEDADYFAAGRVAAVKRRLGDAAPQVSAICEFGCGLGRNLRHLGEAFPRARLVGLDSSAEMVGQARRAGVGTRAVFEPSAEFRDTECFDLVFINGVMHHVPRPEREAVLRRVHALLRPGGLLALFDNNPLNPGAMWVMKRIPFDRDAEPVLAWTLARVARRAAFHVIGMETHFYFPRLLSRLRVLEPGLSWLPLGAQYVLYARR